MLETDLSLLAGESDGKESGFGYNLATFLHRRMPLSSPPRPVTASQHPQHQHNYNTDYLSVILPVRPLQPPFHSLVLVLMACGVFLNLRLFLKSAIVLTMAAACVIVVLLGELRQLPPLTSPISVDKVSSGYVKAELMKTELRQSVPRHFYIVGINSWY